MAANSVNVAGAGRVWIVPVESDPTGVLIPSQAPIIAVLATNPPPGSVGAWYNPGTSPATWRPLISAGDPLPANLARLSAAYDNALCDEIVSLAGDLGAAQPNVLTGHALSIYLGKLIHGYSRMWMLMFGSPESVIDGATLEIPWRRATNEDVVYTFCLDRSGTYVAPEGQIKIDISACTTTEQFALAVQAAFATYLDMGLGRGTNHYPGSPVLIVATSFGGQELNASTWDPRGTAISSGYVSMSAMAGPPATDGLNQIQPIFRQLWYLGEKTIGMIYQASNDTDPRVGVLSPIDIAGRTYPSQCGQTVVTVNGEKAFRRTAGPVEDPGGNCYVPLFRQKIYRGTPEQVGTLLGYFDTPPLYARQARRDVRLRWVIKGVNTNVAAKKILLGLRVNGNAVGFTLAKQIFTMGSPGEGTRTFYQGMAGENSAGYGEFPLLIDYANPIQSRGAENAGIGPGASFGVCLEMTLRIAHQLETVNWSGLGDATTLRHDLSHMRLEWDGWYRDQDIPNEPMAHVHGEGQIVDPLASLGFDTPVFEIDTLGIVALVENESLQWGQVSAIDPASYVEIEYL